MLDVLRDSIVKQRILYEIIVFKLNFLVGLFIQNKDSLIVIQGTISQNRHQTYITWINQNCLLSSIRIILETTPKVWTEAICILLI